MTLAEEMKKAQVAQEKKDRLEREAAQIAEQTRQAAYIEELKNTTFSKERIASEIKEQAGKSHARIKIYQWEDDHPYWQWEILAHVKSILLELGFEEKKIENVFHSMDPVGSDPMFWNTVYDLDVVVTF